MSIFLSRFCVLAITVQPLDIGSSYLDQRLLFILTQGYCLKVKVTKSWRTSNQGCSLFKIALVYCLLFFQEDRRENVNTFFNGLRSHLSDKPYCVCLSDYEFDIDNSKVDLNLKDLKKAIFNVAKSNKSHWGKLNPAKWLTLERQLHEMRQKAVKVCFLIQKLSDAST